MVESQTIKAPTVPALGRDVFDLDQLKTLLDGYSSVTGLTLRLVHYPSFQLLACSGHGHPCKEQRTCDGGPPHLCQVCRELIQSNPPKSEEWTYYRCPLGLTCSALRFEVGDHFTGLLVAGLVEVVKPHEQQENLVIAPLPSQDQPKILEEKDFFQALELLGGIAKLVAEQASARVRLQADLSERERARAAEQAVAESEERLRTLINSMPDIVCFKDGQGRWLIANEFDLDLFELTGVDYRGKTDAELSVYSDFYREAFLTCMDTDEEAWNAGGPSRAEEVIPRPNGTSLVFDVFKVPTFNPDGSRRGLVVVGRDITERKNAERRRRELEEQFRQSQKMEAVGRLAGGVAHDLNNMLTPVLGYADLLNQELEGHEMALSYASDIKAAALRARDLVSRLLAFSRKRDVHLETLDFNEILRGFQRLLRRTIRENVEISYQLCEEPLPILADSNLLEQVLMNLAVNAQDAMPRGGSFTVTTGFVELGEGREPLPGLAGRCAGITVRDTGEGISQEYQDKIFEPFFTTKSVSKGTGLGLAMVYSIIERLGGIVTVSSELGQGTEFQIYLPLSQEELRVGSQESGQAAALRGTETIMVVEDEPLVRQIVVRSLGRLGYKVLEYASSVECLHKIQNHGCSADLMVTDIIMPGLNGVELFQQAKRSCPDLKGLFMSGYSERLLTDELQAELHAEHIQKPFVPRELARRVRAILDN